MSRKFAEVSPYIFDNALVIALSKNWINEFGDVPRFTVLLDKKGHLVIQSVSTTKSVMPN